MLLLHTSDIHLGTFNGPEIDGENARMLDTVRCMNYLAVKARENQVDAILIAGDLWNKSQLWDKQRLKEIGIAANWLRDLTAIAPTVLMFGTNTHENVESFDNIRAMQIPGLTVVTQPEMNIIMTNSGPLQVAAIPGFDKGYFRSKFPGMDATEENVMCSKLLGDILLGLGAQVDSTIPSVLMAHYTVVGCEFDNGEHIFTQSDVVLPKECIAASPFDLVALGHIHRAQEVPNCGRPTFYSGPINGITFNEEGQDKGFWLHEFGETETKETDYTVVGIGYVKSTFIKTPSREFLTMEVDFRDETDLQAAINWELAGISRDNENALLMFPTVSKIVRVHYKCTEEQRKQLSHKAMEQALYKGGAFYVAEIKPVQIVTALSKQELSENSGPMENLKSWAEQEGIDPASLMELAKPLLDAVSAKMPTGKLSGVFEPKRLAVKNYRSYREEEFNFGEVYFATVNGPNGIGKSSFFMDAICDCLYEEPRDGETGSWITAGDARSGMMNFEFGMGDTDWKVVRTRAKSGKTTLALQQLVDGAWVDRGAEKVRDTQNKVVSLLGMDCATFRCVALIMQDAYGLFMEADKTERMEVLANILGLNVYEQLTELARNRVTEVGREITKSKDKIAELNEKLKDLPELEAERVGRQSELQGLATEIQTKETSLQEMTELIQQLKAKMERAEGLKKQANGLGEEISAKATDVGNHRQQLDRAQKMLASEEQILAKSAELELVKESVTVLQTKQPHLSELVNEKSRLERQIKDTTRTIGDIAPRIQQTETLLADRETLEQAAQEYKVAVVDLGAMDKLGHTAGEYDKKILAVEADIDRKIDEGNHQIQILNHFQSKVETLKNKADMLNDSNCIDPENAKCSFLADAQKAKTEIPDVEKGIDEIKAEIARIEEERRPLLKIVADLEAEEAKLNYDSETHYNLRQKVGDLRPKAEQAAQLSAKAELLENLQSQKIQAEEQKSELTTQLAAIQIDAQALADELNRLPELQARIPKLELWAKSKDELPAARQIVATTQGIIDGLLREISTKTEQKQALEKEYNQIEQVSLETHQSQADGLRTQIKYLQADQNKLHSTIGGIDAQIESLTKDKEDLQRVTDEMEPTAKLLVQYQTLSKAFGFDGIPFAIVRAVVPELSAMANDILGQMTGGKMALEIKTDKVMKSNKKEVNALEVWITNWRGNITYKNRSGGEKVKAALANAFALADLKARRAGIQLGMLFVDEPPFQDSQGTEAYCDALELLSERFAGMKVIAISHDPQMMARFPQQIEVVDMGEQGSKVRFVS